MKTVFCFFLILFAINLNAQEIVNCNGKQVTIHGPVCYTLRMAGSPVFLEYHHDLADGKVITSSVGKNTEDEKIREMEVSMLLLSDIKQKDFPIEFSDSHGDSYMTTLTGIPNKVLVTDYEKSGVEKYTKSDMTLYFSEKQALMDFIDRIKKERGF